MPGPSGILDRILQGFRSGGVGLGGRKLANFPKQDGQQLGITRMNARRAQHEHGRRQQHEADRLDFGEGSHQRRADALHAANLGVLEQVAFAARRIAGHVAAAPVQMRIERPGACATRASTLE